MKSAIYTFVALAVACAACGDDDDDRVVIVPDEAPVTDRIVERTDIVSNQPGAEMRDRNLENAWGLSFNPVGVAWVSATETGLSAIYDASGAQVIPPVTILPGQNDDEDTGSPTGQVFNGDDSAFEGDLFIFVTEDGTISGWQPDFGSTAMMRVDNSGDRAVYKGVAIADTGDGWRLYAADFRNAAVTVYDENYSPADIDGTFTDPDLPAGFAPFNIEAVDDTLLIAYAVQDDDAEDDVKGQGNGVVSRFDLDGNFIARVLTGAELNSPWGMVVTPDSFSAAPNRLLVGNFGDGAIHVYSMDISDLGATATLEGQLQDTNGNNIVIDGLWALEFGVDAGGFSSDALYFTAGPNDEEDGIFGVLTSSVIPDDGTNTGGTTGGTAGSSGGRNY